MLSLDTLTCEYFTNPIGLDVRQPRLSWKLRTEQRGARQKAYQLQVTAAPATSRDADQATADLLWDTGKVQSALSIHIPYGGEPLQPGQRCHWRVRVWDEDNVVSPWSEPAFWGCSQAPTGKPPGSRRTGKKI
jgi:alpha-L-rhamnosidase